VWLAGDDCVPVVLLNVDFIPGRPTTRRTLGRRNLVQFEESESISGAAGGDQVVGCPRAAASCIRTPRRRSTIF
jgi:hypothetical protein